MDAAILQFLGDFRLEHQVPAIEFGVVAEALLDLIDIDADAGGAPHVVDRILVARIVGGGALLDHVPHIRQVRQLRLVQLLEDAGRDLPRQEGGRRYDDIVPGAAGKQLGFQNLVRIEDVVDHLDAGLGGELLEDFLVDIVGPVIDMDDLVLGLGGEGRRQTGQQAGREQQFTHRR